MYSSQAEPFGVFIQEIQAIFSAQNGLSLLSSSSLPISVQLKPSDSFTFLFNKYLSCLLSARYYAHFLNTEVKKSLKIIRVTGYMKSYWIKQLQNMVYC